MVAQQRVDLPGARRQRMSSYVTVIVYHGGILARNDSGVLEYVGGEIDVWEDLDSDTLNLFDLYSIVKVCKGYDMVDKLMWRAPNLDLDFGLRELSTDSSFMEMVRAAFDNDNEIEIYHDYNPLPIRLLPPIIEIVDVDDEDVNQEEMTEDAVNVEQMAEEDQDVKANLFAEEGYSTADESAEDSHYRPFPVISEGESEEVQNRKKVCSSRKGKEKVGSSTKGKEKVGSRGNRKRSSTPPSHNPNHNQAKGTQQHKCRLQHRGEEDME